MEIKLLGIDMARPFAVLLDWMERERLCFANGSSGTDCWTFSLRCRSARLRRNTAAECITSGVFFLRRDICLI